MSLKKAASGRPKPRVRDRIFDTACELFHQRGIRDVGVDSIASEAGSNKMSFYRSFASKDELVAQYLAQKSHEFWVWWGQIIGAHQNDARAQIEALFDAFLAAARGEKSCGCAFTNATLELADENHPNRLIALQHKAEVRRRFRDLAARTGAPRANELGDALMLLMEGGHLARRTFGPSGGPLQNIASTVRVLIDAHLRSPRST